MSKRRNKRRTATQDAPLYQEISALAMYSPMRFHMPGHKGRPIFRAFEEVFAMDFTETYGTGNLYEGKGPIRAAEERAAQYYQAADCHFLTGGASQGIHAMLALAAGTGGAVLLDRACHKSVMHACALYDLDARFLYPEQMSPFGFGGVITPDAVALALAQQPEVRAVMVVSPNYYGVVQDVEAIAAVCHKRDVKLLVDSAHGAHFPAVGIPSPITQGADMAVLSAHKTLPSMGQGAYLLAGEGMDLAALRRFEEMAGTSSPSYPIMISLDLARAWLENEGGPAYRWAAAETARLRRWITKKTPFTVLDETHCSALDPCRLTVCLAGTGWDGQAAADFLYHRYGAACEMNDARNLVFILTGADGRIQTRVLRHALGRLAKQSQTANEKPLIKDIPMPRAHMAQPVRKAWFGPCRVLPLKQAEGQICARPITPYPPGIPILWPGEKITAQHIEFLRTGCYTSIREIAVIAPE